MLKWAESKINVTTKLIHKMFYLFQDSFKCTKAATQYLFGRLLVEGLVDEHLFWYIMLYFHDQFNFNEVNCSLIVDITCALLGTPYIITVMVI